MAFDSIEQAVEILDAEALDAEMVLQIREVGNMGQSRIARFDGRNFKQEMVMRYGPRAVVVHQGHLVFGCMSEEEKHFIKDTAERFDPIPRPFPVIALSSADRLYDVCDGGGVAMKFDTFADKMLAFDRSSTSGLGHAAQAAGADFYLNHCYYIQKLGIGMAFKRLEETQFGELRIIPEGIFAAVYDREGKRMEDASGNKVVRLDNADGETVYHPVGELPIGRGHISHLQAANAGKTFYFALYTKTEIAGEQSAARWEKGREVRKVLRAKPGYYIDNVHFFPKGSIKD